jgi:hypothetical protein
LLTINLPPGARRQETTGSEFLFINVQQAAKSAFARRRAMA